MKKFKFVSELKHPKTFVRKNTLIKFEISEDSLLIKGSYLDYNWDNNFKSAVIDLYNAWKSEELNCIQKKNEKN
jgi:hypothetical protein